MDKSDTVKITEALEAAGYEVYEVKRHIAFKDAMNAVDPIPAGLIDIRVARADSSGNSE